MLFINGKLLVTVDSVQIVGRNRISHPMILEDNGRYQKISGWISGHEQLPLLSSISAWITTAGDWSGIEMLYGSGPALVLEVGEKGA